MIVALLCTACWGDDVPSLDRIGAIRTGAGEVSILFAGCPGEGVERVALLLADDNFAETERVLWEIEADGSNAASGPFVVGAVPPGFREITSLEGPLEASDHVHLVVTSSDIGTIPMSFVVGDVREDEVLVRRTLYRDRADFDDHAAASCRG